MRRLKSGRLLRLVVVTAVLVGLLIGAVTAYALTITGAGATLATWHSTIKAGSKPCW